MITITEAAAGATIQTGRRKTIDRLTVAKTVTHVDGPKVHVCYDGEGFRLVDPSGIRYQGLAATEAEAVGRAALLLVDTAS